jgi:hypothetical protein
MARKKRRERQPVKPAGASKSSSASTHSEPEMSVHALTQGDPLVDEVQSFVAKRSELAKKVAEEIKTTEKKLAELRKTAAMLSPDSGGAAAPKERKPAPKERKPKPAKPKSSKREAKPEEASPETPQEPAAE